MKPKFISLEELAKETKRAKEWLENLKAAITKKQKELDYNEILKLEKKGIKVIWREKK